MVATSTAIRQPVPAIESPTSDSAPLPHSQPVLRQTQAVIGTVLLAGVAAAMTLGPGWVVVPAVVGIGLLAAGITGVCPMALLIARLPWNRAAERAHRARRGCCGG